MYMIYDGNILIKKIIRNTKKWWKCTTLTFKGHIYTGRIEVIKVLGDHEAALSFLGDLMADIMKERLIKRDYHQSSYMISHFDVTDFLI